jgi:hypothetical protein
MRQTNKPMLVGTFAVGITKQNFQSLSKLGINFDSLAGLSDYELDVFADRYGLDDLGKFSFKKVLKGIGKVAKKAVPFIPVIGQAAGAGIEMIEGKIANSKAKKAALAEQQAQAAAQVQAVAQAAEQQAATTPKNSFFEENKYLILGGGGAVVLVIILAVVLSRK